MKQAEKDAWVAALRSGEFKQGQQALQRPDNTFCCLGVLECGLRKVEYTPAYEDHGPDYMLGKSNMPVDYYVMMRAELGDDVVDTLIDMNDSGSSFDAIAQYIVDNVKVEKEV